MLEDRHQNLAFVEFRVGQRPGDGQSGRGAHQVRAQAPEESGVTCAVSITGPPGQVRAFHRRSGAGTFDRGGANHPDRIGPQVGVVADDDFQSGVGDIFPTHVLPPFFDGGNGEDRGVMVDSDGDPGAVVGQVIDSVQSK